MPDQLTVPPTKREQVLQRSQKMSLALHDAARKARLSVRGGRWQGSYSRGGRASRSFAMVSAIVVFILPTLCGAVYFGLIAADQYLVEAQFAVKARQPEPTDTLGKLTGMPALQQSQDSLVVVDYIQSRAIVEKLDALVDLRGMYSRPEVTWLERFDPADPIEKLTRYWKKMAVVTVETSGIVNLRLRAFRPDDALRIGQATLDLSEKLINDLSLRTRQDALSKAQRDVERAEKRLVEIRDDVRRVRDQEGLIDPKKTNESLLLVLGSARVQRIKVEDEIRVQSRTLTSAAPQLQILKARLEAITGQIAKLESEMTAARGPEGGALARSFTSYDKVALDQQSAEKLYTVIAASLEKARMDVDRQQVFVESFVEPVLPQEAEFPRRIWNTFLVGFGTFVGWFLLNYVRSSIKGI